MSGRSADGDTSGVSTLERIANMASGIGRYAAVPMLRSFLCEQVVGLIRQHDPEELERLIMVQYPLVRKQLPQEYKQTLSTIGPQFEEAIIANVNPESIKKWLSEPEEWMDEEEYEAHGEEVEECARVIEETSGGDEWLEANCLDFYAICEIV